MTHPIGSVHPLLACADALETSLKDVVDVAPQFMTTDEKAEALRRLHQLGDQLAELRLRVLAASADVAEDAGDRDVACWLARETRSDRAEQRRDLDLALAFDRRWQRLAEAVSDGRVNLPQSRVITRALDDLPEREVSREVLVQAEATMIGYAAEYGPGELRNLGRKILEVAAPERYDEQEAAALEREERRAREATALHLRRLGDGVTRITMRVPDAIADRFRTYLEAFTSPRHHGSGEGDHEPMRRRLGHAFGAFLEAADPERLPLHGGDATTLLVTIDLDALMGRLRDAGMIGPEGRISAGEARRLACTAHLVPVVLGGKSEVLDLGRARRLFSPAQRKGMAVRDRRCRAEGCTVPAAWCEAHHLTPWSLDGKTDLGDGVLLCSFHHHRAHDDRYLHDRLPDGGFRFTRRT